MNPIKKNTELRGQRVKIEYKTLPEQLAPQHDKFDIIVVNVSGGKDSGILLLWATQYYPLYKLVAIHAEIDIDWHETKAVAQAQCDRLGIPLFFCHSRNKAGQQQGFTDILLRGRTDRKTKEHKETMFPSMAQRWCTSQLKSGPINTWINQTYRGKQALSLTGERWQESANRAELRPVDSVSPTITQYRPILAFTESDVWAMTDHHRIPKHPCYNLGVSRASCAICIFSSDKEIAIAAKHAPDIVKRYIEAEKKISHTFRYKPATKKRPAMHETIEQILIKQGVTL